MKVFLVFICLTIQFAFGQSPANDWKSRFYLEPSIFVKGLAYTQLESVAKTGGYYLASDGQFRLGLNLDVCYLNRFFNVGLGSTIFAYGWGNDLFTETSFPFYDIYLKGGFNFLSFKRDCCYRFGPTFNFGKIRKERFLGIDYEFNIGLEFNNNLKHFAFTYGMMRLTKEEQVLQNLKGFNQSNAMLTFSFGYMFPIRKPKQIKFLQNPMFQWD